MNKGHPKLVARGSESEDAGLKFKGAPADDCDPFAIQNYIDRLAAEVYDVTNPPKDIPIKEGQDEWELMKEKARNVPFKEVNLSIALKHGLLDEVKKENSNKSFEKDSILTIMKVRDEFLHDYADASAFEYQWQIWVEWERYLKQIGVTIPQWGKIARKLIRLGVQRIQEDMTKKYTQIASGSNKRKPADAEDATQDRRRRVTLPVDNTAPGYTSTIGGVPIIHRSSSFGGYMDAPFASSSYSSTPATPGTPNDQPPYSPMQSPIATSPPFRPPFDTTPQPAFGASLYNMIHSNSSPASMFAASPIHNTSMLSPSPMLSPTQQLSLDSPHSFPYTLGNTAYPYDTNFIASPHSQQVQYSQLVLPQSPYSLPMQFSTMNTSSNLTYSNPPFAMVTPTSTPPAPAYSSLSSMSPSTTSYMNTQPFSDDGNMF